MAKKCGPTKMAKGGAVKKSSAMKMSPRKAMAMGKKPVGASKSGAKKAGVQKFALGGMVKTPASLRASGPAQNNPMGRPMGDAMPPPPGRLPPKPAPRPAPSVPVKPVPAPRTIRPIQYRNPPIGPVGPNGEPTGAVAAPAPGDALYQQAVKKMAKPPVGKPLPTVPRDVGYGNGIGYDGKPVTGNPRQPISPRQPVNQGIDLGRTAILTARRTPYGDAI